MNSDLVPMLLDVSIDPCDGSVHPSLQYVLIRGFTAMGWEQPRSASEDMAMEILKMIRPSRPDAGADVREALLSLIELCERNIYPQPDKPNSDWARVQAAKAALSTSSDAGNAIIEASESCRHGRWDCADCDSAEARLREALNNLRNEVKGALSISDWAIREAIGNTNVNCIQQRIDEADLALSPVGDEAKKSEGGGQDAPAKCSATGVHPTDTSCAAEPEVAPGPSDPPDRREIVARIVDPEAYEPINEVRWESIARLESQAEAQLKAERKATAILAALDGGAKNGPPRGLSAGALKVGIEWYQPSSRDGDIARTVTEIWTAIWDHYARALDGGAGA